MPFDNMLSASNLQDSDEMSQRILGIFQDSSSPLPLAHEGLNSLSYSQKPDEQDEMKQGSEDSAIDPDLSSSQQQPQESSSQQQSQPNDLRSQIHHFQPLFTLDLDKLSPDALVKLMSTMASIQPNEEAILAALNNPVILPQQQVGIKGHNFKPRTITKVNDAKLDVRRYKTTKKAASRWATDLTKDDEGNTEMIVGRDTRQTLYIPDACRSTIATDASLTICLAASDEQWRDQEKGTDRTSMFYGIYLNEPKSGDMPLQGGVLFSGKDEVIQFELSPDCDKIFIMTTPSGPASFKRDNKLNQPWRPISLTLKLQIMDRINDAMSSINCERKYKLVAKTQEDVKQAASTKAKKAKKPELPQYDSTSHDSSSYDESKDKKKIDVKHKLNPHLDSDSDCNDTSDKPTKKKCKRKASNRLKTKSTNERKRFKKE